MPARLKRHFPYSGIPILAALIAIVWRAPFWGSWVESSAVQYENLFYIGASDLRRVTCYDPTDGHVVWRTDVFGWNWGRPLVTAREYSMTSWLRLSLRTKSTSSMSGIGLKPPSSR